MTVARYIALSLISRYHCLDPTNRDISGLHCIQTYPCDLCNNQNTLYVDMVYLSSFVFDNVYMPIKNLNLNLIKLLTISVKLWYTNMEHSVASIEAKANVCCVKFNPESRYHLTFGSAGRERHTRDILTSLTGELIPLDWVNFEESQWHFFILIL